MLVDRAIHFCSNCQLNLPNDSESDFHRYNIRRRLLGLGASNYETFQKKFLESQSNTSCSSSQNGSYFCDTCKKPFLSQGTYSQHLNSQKHRQNLKMARLNPSEKSDAGAVKHKERCLFCEYSAPEFEQMLDHMHLIHGFFIRDEDCCVEKDALIEHLRKLIEEQNYCLCCPSTFQSGEAAKKHMIDKGHCFMPKEQYSSFVHYYDFKAKLLELMKAQSNLPEIIEVEESQGQSEVEIISQSRSQSQIQSQSDCSFIVRAESAQTVDFDVVELTVEQTKRKLEFQQLLEQLQSSNQAKLLENGELLLPNGKILGHRAMRKYYQQNHVVPVVQIDRTKGIECNYQPNEAQNGGSLDRLNLINTRYLKKRE